MKKFLIQKYNVSKKRYYKLNELEKKYLYKNPHKAFLINKVTSIAFEETRKRFIKSENFHNNQADAFRHCYWSALLVKNLGYIEAKKFSDMHEEGNNKNPIAEKKMDLHNNKIGLQLGKFIRTKNNQKIANACFEAIENRGKWLK